MDNGEHECEQANRINNIQEELHTVKVNFVNVNNTLVRIESVLGEVKAQTTKTNGRVTKIEQLILVSKVVLITGVVAVLMSKLGLMAVLLKFL